MSLKRFIAVTSQALKKPLSTAPKSLSRFQTLARPRVPVTAKKTGQGLFAKTVFASGAILLTAAMQKEREQRTAEEDSVINEAKRLDAIDPFQARREQFIFPIDDSGNPYVYLNGNSLGLAPIVAKEFVLKEIKEWEQKGVRGHFDKENPWLSYHETVTPSLARLVGAKPSEVVAMGSLTGNLNLALISFYQPTKERYKIIRLSDAFGSDKYAVDSQIEQRIATIKKYAPEVPVFDAKSAVVEIKPKDGTKIISTQEILDVINQHGDSTSVVLIEGINYLSGQYFDLKAISEAAHAKGCKIGVDLAHSFGNTFPELHKWNIDFAAWCDYKYGNSGPGAIGGLFIHEKHHTNPNLPRLAGWWGHDKTSRFKMPADFVPIQTAEAWQQSNPPIWQLASLRASMLIFDSVENLETLREKSKRLTGHMERLLKEMLPNEVEIITPSNPEERGSQLSLRVKVGEDTRVESWLHEHGFICDARRDMTGHDIIRVAPTALYNTHEDVARFVIGLRKLCHAHTLEMTETPQRKLR